MAATYDPLHPTNKDRARAILGDTEVVPAEDALHTDEHINAQLAEHGYALGVAALAHELWARFAQAPQRVTLTGLSIDLSAQLDVWKALAAPWLHWLQTQAAAAAAVAPTGTPRPRPVATTRAARFTTEMP